MPQFITMGLQRNGNNNTTLNSLPIQYTPIMDSKYNDIDKIIVISTLITQ